MVDTAQNRIIEREIWSVRSAEIAMNGVTFAPGSTADITSAVTTLLATAGKGNISVAIKVSANENDTGLVVGEISEVLDTNNEPIVSPTSGEEIYGRVTEASGVYTLSLYEKIAGVETAYTTASTLTCNVSLPYAFNMKDFPRDGVWKTKSKKIQNDKESAGRTYREQLTITGLNTVSNTTKTVKDVLDVTIRLGKSHRSGQTPNPSFTITNAGVVTWLPANAGFDIDTTQVLVIEYTTVQ